MNDRLNLHINMLESVKSRLENAGKQAEGLVSEEILHQLGQVIDQLREHSDSAYDSGQDWLAALFTHHPQLAPAVNRDLLWFFGGECLHFLTDAEIDQFQQLDELEALANAQGEPFDRALTLQTLKTGDQQPS